MAKPQKSTPATATAPGSTDPKLIEQGSVTAPATTASSTSSVDALMQRMSLLPGLPMAPETPLLKETQVDDPNRPETEEDGLRAGALRRLKVRRLLPAQPDQTPD